MESSKLIEFKSNPQSIQYSKDLTKDSYSNINLDNTFYVLKTSDNILYLIYATENKSIIFYNLANEQKVNEIQNAHENFITNFRYFYDKNNKIDILMSISGEDHNIKLWNVGNQKCLHDIKNVNKSGFLNSACLLYDNNQYYIVTSDVDYSGNPEPIKIFDLNGNKLKEIKDSQDDVLFLDTYYDKKSSKIYIIAGANGQIKSYDYKENKLYKCYKDKENNSDHKSIIIDDREDVVKMIESSEDGKVRVWNFLSGDLLNTINVSDKALYGLCLWNKDNVFVGSEDKSLKLVDLKAGKVTKELTGHTNDVITILKVTHPQLGECLVSQGWVYDQIKLWVIKN